MQRAEERGQRATEGVPREQRGAAAVLGDRLHGLPEQEIGIGLQAQVGVRGLRVEPLQQVHGEARPHQEPDGARLRRQIPDVRPFDRRGHQQQGRRIDGDRRVGGDPEGALDEKRACGQLLWPEPESIQHAALLAAKPIGGEQCGHSRRDHRLHSGVSQAQHTIRVPGELGRMPVDERQDEVGPVRRGYHDLRTHHEEAEQ